MIEMLFLLFILFGLCVLGFFLLMGAVAVTALAVKAVVPDKDQGHKQVERRLRDYDEKPDTNCYGEKL